GGGLPAKKKARRSRARVNGGPKVKAASERSAVTGVTRDRAVLRSGHSDQASGGEFASPIGVATYEGDSRFAAIIPWSDHD
ncbi:hypothetical protein, partial [Zavarzinia sp.]|uniref:hypothetical protein n=1 Tax=Zavarzinia sp. TaxID=2027920 RepID=UPI003565DDFD